MTPSKRIAVNRVVMPDSSVLGPAVLEIEEGVVTKVSPLERELPFTQWEGGTVTLREIADDRLHAYKDGENIKQEP